VVLAQLVPLMVGPAVLLILVHLVVQEELTLLAVLEQMVVVEAVVMDAQ
jgi:hypothetical protein